MDKSGAKKELEPKINNFGSATLVKILAILHTGLYSDILEMLFAAG